MKSTVLFLGTGASVGVPVIGCTCHVCTSTKSVNKRLRPSVFLQLSQGKFLIDVGPDFRAQALNYGITSIDGVLLTHAHHDHTSGLDDLRPLTYKRTSPIPILLSRKTAEDIQNRYYYLFPDLDSKEQSSFFQLQLLPQEQTGRVIFQNVPIQYVTYEQGGMLVNGFRIGNLAYLSDIKHFSTDIFDQLKGVSILILSALRYAASPLHFSIDEAIDFARELQVKQVWLTHLSHELEYEQANAYLPKNMKLAHDGLIIPFNEVA